MIVYLIPILMIVSILFSAIRILKEYERGVIFTLGRYTSVGGPGIIIVIPFIQTVTKVDMRVIVMDIPPQDVISRDNISVKVNAVLYFRVVEAEKAIIQVEEYLSATSQLAQTTLRSVLGQHELDEMISDREKINTDIQTIIDQETDAWGIKVTNVEIKDIDLDESMIRVIAKQAEAERNRRAKLIHADGELEASKKLLDAAKTLSAEPQALQLRYLQTLNNIADEKNSTIVFPLPMEFMLPFKETMRKFLDKK